MDFGKRPDGTPKGNGWLGVLKRPDGDVSTELTIGVELDGKEVNIPLIVPTLSPDEVKYLLKSEPGKMPIPDEIMNKAVDHAVGRLREGKSPYAD